MNHEIHVITNVLGREALLDFGETYIALSDVSAGDIIRIVNDGKCIDELLVINGDIDNQCDMCAASNVKEHHCLCASVPCNRGKGCNPRILVSVSDMLECL